MQKLPIDLTPFFAAYEGIVAEAETVFDHIAKTYNKEVHCKKACADCCHALFDLSLIEALYINQAFIEDFPFGEDRSKILTKAAKVDRELTRLKKSYYKNIKEANPTKEDQAKEIVNKIFLQAANAKVPCPLLDSDNLCQMYKKRPITCRIYGVPTEIEGKAHVCGKANFTQGKAYPTVKIEKLQAKLESLSHDLQKALGSRFASLYKVYVPLSMALLTQYDAKYLGALGEAVDKNDIKAEKK